MLQSLIQCQRKWDSLLEDHLKVDKLESHCSMKDSSYWLLQSERGEKLGLHKSFNIELFTAIGISLGLAKISRRRSRRLGMAK